MFIGVLNSPNPSTRSVALGSTQEDHSGVKARPALKADNLTFTYEPIV
jgi:hypothetical protein